MNRSDPSTLANMESSLPTTMLSSIDQIRKSPQLEGFAAKGIEVLLLTDAVDEFWLPAVGEFDGE